MICYLKRTLQTCCRKNNQINPLNSGSCYVTSWLKAHNSESTEYTVWVLRGRAVSVTRVCASTRSVKALGCYRVVKPEALKPQSFLPCGVVKNTWKVAYPGIGVSLFLAIVLPIKTNNLDVSTTLVRSLVFTPGWIVLGCIVQFPRVRSPALGCSTTFELEMPRSGSRLDCAGL